MSPALEALSRCVACIAKVRTEIVGQLERAEAFAVEAVHAYENGDHGRARALLEKACDVEFEALFDCEATGGLAQDLYPDDIAAALDDDAAGDTAADSEIAHSLRLGGRS